MYDIRLIDENNAVIGIKWGSDLTVQGVERANKELEQIIDALPLERFDLIVDMREVVVFKPETQKGIVQHQEWLLEKGMDQAAVIVKSNIAKLQLRRTSQQSNHSNEHHFLTEEEALAFLKNK